MKANPFSTIALLLAGAMATLHGESAPPVAASLLPGGSDKWQLSWSDEFDYPDSKLEERWISQNSASTHILSSRWRENAVVAGGTLKLINKKEKRGGKDWTSGNIWTREKFQYGYFECRYRYAAADGTNNSFWLMTNDKPPAGRKSFEIDINEGHYPNEVNTNIHNHSDVIMVNGKKTHPTSSRSFQFGVRPDVTIQLENPVKTKRIRFSSNHGGHVHLGEFRIFNPVDGGYPDAFGPVSKNTGLVNLASATSTKITTSGFLKTGTDTSRNLADGKPDTRWTSQKEGMKWVEFGFPEDRVVGGVQFLNGYGKTDDWKGLVSDHRVSWHDGSGWVAMSSFDVKDGAYNFARDFQTYGLDWTEKELVFYLNGKELRREKNVFCHHPSPVWLSLAIIPWAGNITDAIDGTFMEVDHVRIYQRKPRAQD
jgi:beta-glucanase (GH16 family)